MFDKLDDYTQKKILEKNRVSLISRLIKKHKLSVCSIETILRQHNDNIRLKLIEDQNLDFLSLCKMVNYTTNSKIFDRLLEYKNLPNHVLRTIGYYGKHRHRNIILEKFSLDLDIRHSIAACGNKRHRLKILEADNLDDVTLQTIIRKGSYEELWIILEKFKLNVYLQHLIWKLGSIKQREYMQEKMGFVE